jgi:MFS transporter, DHA1 family, inner membrane transport protein
MNRETPVTIAVMILMGIGGAQTTVILPALVSAIGVAFSMNATTSAWLAAAEMGGVGLGAFVAGMRVASADRRHLALTAAAVATAGNLASMLTTHVPALLAMRFVGALGAGGLLATMAATVGSTKRPERIFGIFVALTYAVAAADFLAAPQVVARWGASGLFLALAAFDILIAAAVAATRIARPSETVEGPLPGWTRAVWLGLASVTAYYIGIGGIWSFMPRLGASMGASAVMVSQVLSQASVAAIFGAASASALSAALSRPSAIMIGLGGIIIALLALAAAPGSTTFAVAPLLLLFCWSMVVPFLLGALAHLDPGGRAVALTMTLQYVGFAGGPLLAAAISSAIGTRAVAMMCAAGPAAAMILMVTALTQHARETKTF